MKKDFRLFKNKRGWVRVVEAFVAILLIAGIVLTLLGGGYISKEDPSPKIYDAEVAVLRDIQNNNSLRSEIASANPLPVEWNNFPSDIKGKIQLDPPNYLECEGKICDVGDSCILNNGIEKDVYARSVLISDANSPRQLKIFCWEK